MNGKLLMLLIIIIVIAGTLGYIFVSRGPSCGNEKCESGENCGNCYSDCGCSPDEYCSAYTHECKKPVCGNRVCELLENPSTCCRDCGCYGNNEICNEQNECEKFVSKLTDEDVETAIRNYFKSKGREDELLNVSNFAVTTFDNKPARSATISLVEQHSQGGILLENGTLVIKEKTSTVDVWTP